MMLNHAASSQEAPSEEQRLSNLGSHVALWRIPHDENHATVGSAGTSVNPIKLSHLLMLLPSAVHLRLKLNSKPDAVCHEGEVPIGCLFTALLKAGRYLLARNATQGPFAENHACFLLTISPVQTGIHVSESTEDLN